MTFQWLEPVSRCMNRFICHDLCGHGGEKFIKIDWKSINVDIGHKKHKKQLANIMVTKFKFVVVTEDIKKRKVTPIRKQNERSRRLCN